MPEVALHASHLALGAKMGPFGGWDMPIEYAAGTVAEHTAVRTAVGLFDVSQMTWRASSQGRRNIRCSAMTQAA